MLFQRLYACIDHISFKEQRNKRHAYSEIELTQALIPDRAIQNQITPTKLSPLYLIVVSLMIVLVARLAELQLVKGSFYQVSAQKNMTAKILQPAPRGIIKDSKGQLLAFNSPFVINGTQAQKYTGLQAASIDPSTIQPRREYPCYEACAHLLGYTSLISPEELARDKLQSNSFINSAAQKGRTGLEQYYDSVLSGQDGYVEHEIDATGKLLREIGGVPAVAGFNLNTSLDKSLQEFIYQKLQYTLIEKNAKGASVIVMHPKTGAILAMVNAPSYNNNLFTSARERSGDLSKLLSDPQLPLINRAVTGLYPPASTYKIVTSLALLGEGTLTRDTKIQDTGKIEISGTVFNNWYYTSYGRTDGEVDLVKAMARSNDTYYYNASLKLGIDKLVHWSRLMGLGVASGIDLTGESRGLIPSPAWKQEVKKEQWYPGNTVNMSIGQGDLLATPIQVALFTAAIANRGTIVTPSVVQSLSDQTGQIVCQRDHHNGSWTGVDCRNLSPTRQVKLNIDRAHLEAVEAGMIAANAFGGTATPFFSYPMATAGKTGTAESTPGQPPHAWYTIYAPLQAPEVVITVLFENGGEGSSVAAPIAKEILDYLYF